ncbi:MAG: biopolymer transporter Tol [Candidatus Kapabacteria bacterium]|nr:biopolymer transporter Tol [Candidatus Kapabacteria bacterium]
MVIYGSLKLKNLLILVIFFLYIFNSNLCAQFGKNKVQYDNFNWKYLESKHFDVYYSEGTKYLAEFTAMKAESDLKNIEKALNYRINNRITIIAYASHNQFQQSNVVSSYLPEGVGGVTELFKNRMVLPFQGSYDLFEHVINHELVHAVLNDWFYGGTIQSTVGSNMVEIPLWMNEGLAEYLSSGGMDTHTDVFMRDLCMSDYIPDLEMLNGYLAYRGGQTFFAYIADKYGKAKVGELLRQLHSSFTLDAAFKNAFKMNLREFSEKWKKDLKKYYWPDIDKFNDPVDFATQITDHREIENFYNTSPSISPDGTKMAFISDDEGLFGIYTLNLEKKHSRELLVSSFRRQDFEQLNILTPGISWSPDGKNLCISAKSGGEDAIYIINVKKNDYEKLKFGFKSISSVIWSPDGDYLAFIASVVEKSDLFLYNIKTKELRNLTNDIFTDLNPCWSPDSKKIYFISDRTDHLTTGMGTTFKMWNTNVKSSDIYCFNIDSASILRISSDPQYQKSSIAISPDGTKMLFVSDKNGIGNIYEMNLASGNIKPKTNSLNGIAQLSLSPDGSKLLFSTQINAGYDIFMIRYPFDKNIEKDSLPKTRFRKKVITETNITGLFDIDSSVTQSPDKPKITKGYGNFEIDMKNQQFVRKNDDIVKTQTNELNSISLSPSDTTLIEKDYKIRFSTDLIVGNPYYSNFYGYQGATQMLFSDVLGDHQIYAQANLMYDLKNSSIFVQYSYLPKKIDYHVALYHSVIITSVSNDYYSYYRFRDFGIDLKASLPFDVFNRLDWGISWKNLTRENTDPSISELKYKMLIIPEVRYVHDDVLWGYFAPNRGTRYNLQIKGTPKLGADGLSFITAKTDARAYIPFWNYCFALRGTAGASFGPNPQRFSLGGEEGWLNGRALSNRMPFNNPEDFAFYQDLFIMPMRGWEFNSIFGSKYFVANAEFRFPLVRALIAGPLPVVFQAMMGSFFFDVGGAFDTQFNSVKIDDLGNKYPGNLIMSTGIGIRSYVLGLPFKMDVAWRNNYSSWSQPDYMFSLGYDF